MTAETHTTTKATRRTLLAGIGAASVAAPALALSPAPAADPVVGIIAEWKAVHAELFATIDRADALLADLEARGIHQFIVYAGRRLYTEREIVELFVRDCPAMEAAKARELARFAEVRARWEAEWEATGGAALWARQDELEAHEDRLIKAAWATPARSLAGVAAKLQIVAVYGRRSDDADDDMHVLALRNVLDDLAGMTPA